MSWWRMRNGDQFGGASAENRQHLQQQHNAEARKGPSMAAVAKALIFTRRRLRVSNKKHIHFLYEPGKQVSSAVKVKNTSSCLVAFKFQTNSPKSCFMRPPSGILTPGETIVASVVKFIEPLAEQNQAKKKKEKFRIVSLKVEQGSEFSPELFEERKEFVAVEKVLEVVFLDPQSRSPEIEKLKKHLAEAEAAQQALRKPSLEEKVHKTVAAGGVLDDWFASEGAESGEPASAGNLIFDVFAYW